MNDQIERELVLPAPPDQVWEVITSPGWLAEDVELDLEPGGDANLGERTGWVEEAVPPERLVFWWADDGEPATRVEMTLRPDADGSTRLRVVESRPLDVLDVVGIPLPGADGANSGPVMLVAA